MASIILIAYDPSPGVNQVYKLTIQKTLGTAPAGYGYISMVGMHLKK